MPVKELNGYKIKAEIAFQKNPNGSTYPQIFFKECDDIEQSIPILLASEKPRCPHCSSSQCLQNVLISRFPPHLKIDEMAPFHQLMYIFVNCRCKNNSNKFFVVQKKFKPIKKKCCPFCESSLIKCKGLIQEDEHSDTFFWSAHLTIMPRNLPPNILNVIKSKESLYTYHWEWLMHGFEFQCEHCKGIFTDRMLWEILDPELNWWKNHLANELVPHWFIIKTNKKLIKIVNKIIGISVLENALKNTKNIGLLNNEKIICPKCANQQNKIINIKGVTEDSNIPNIEIKCDFCNELFGLTLKSKTNSQETIISLLDNLTKQGYLIESKFTFAPFIEYVLNDEKKFRKYSFFLKNWIIKKLKEHDKPYNENF